MSDEEGEGDNGEFDKNVEEEIRQTMRTAEEEDEKMKQARYLI